MYLVLISIHSLFLSPPVSSKLGSIESRPRAPTDVKYRFNQIKSQSRPSYRCSTDGKLPIPISVGSSVWTVDTKEGIKNALNYLSEVLDKSISIKGFSQSELPVDVKLIERYITELKEAERIQKECYPQSMEIEDDSVMMDKQLQKSFLLDFMLILFALALCVLQQLTQLKDGATGVVKGLSEYTNEEFTAFQKQRKEFKDQFSPTKNLDGTTTSKKPDTTDLHLIRIFDAVEKAVSVCRDCGEQCPIEISKLDQIISGSGKSTSSSISSAVTPEMATNFKKVSQIIDNGYYFGCSLKIGGQMFYKALEEVNSDRSTFFKVVSITSYLAKGLSSILRPLFKKRVKSLTDNQLFDRSLRYERGEADRVLGDYVTHEDLDEARRNFKNSPDTFPDSYLNYGRDARNAIRTGKVDPRTMPDEIQTGLREYGSRDNIKGLMNTFAKTERHAYKEAKRYNNEDVSDTESEYDEEEDEEDEEDEYDFGRSTQKSNGARGNPASLNRQRDIGKQQYRNSPSSKQKVQSRTTSSRFVNDDDEYGLNYDSDDDAEEEDALDQRWSNSRMSTRQSPNYPRTPIKSQQRTRGF